MVEAEEHGRDAEQFMLGQGDAPVGGFEPARPPDQAATRDRLMAAQDVTPDHGARPARASNVSFGFAIAQRYAQRY
jgi:hypothetical protein